MTAHSAAHRDRSAFLSAASPAVRPVDRTFPTLTYVHVIYRHRYLALSILLLAVLGSLVRTYTTTPMYRARARLLIEMGDGGSAAMSGLDSGNHGYASDPEPYYQTQYRILAGHQLARRVGERLNLTRIGEFNGTGPTPTDLSGLVTTLRQRLEKPIGMILGRPGPQSPPAGATIDRAALTANFLSRVSVEPIENSQFVDVAFVSADPQFAARAANVLVEEYVQQNLELRRQDMTRSLDWLSQELKKQQQTVEDSERALAQYREDQNALSLEGRQNIVVARLNQLNDAVTRAKTTRVEKESLYNQIASLGPSASPDTIPAILQNPYIQSVKSRLADLHRDKATLLERYGDKYPDVIKVNANIQDASDQLQAELLKAIAAIRHDYQSAVTEEQALAAALEEQKSAAMDLNRKSIGYTVLEHDAQSNRQLYETLLHREKELQISASGRGNNVRLTERAEPPKMPFAPDPSRDLTVALAVGLALALSLLAVVDHFDDTIKTPEDITGKLRLPFLGLLPAVKANRRPILSDNVTNDFGEAVRSLRTAVVFSSASQGTGIVLVTSAQAEEGKTTTACNLALALARGGTRVLLMDADMRHPSVHEAFGLKNSRGLSHLLSGQAHVTEVVQRLSNPPDLWVMTAGLTPPNPSELLASARMSAFMSNAQHGPFDWIIIDTPPVLAVTDALMLTPWVLGVTFVIGSERTSLRYAERAIGKLAVCKSRILGGVLNRVDFSLNKYYYSQYYGSQYYGSQYQETYGYRPTA